uniref:Uncharacterized protein n=1 Tax=Arundo donax TaxID=35708 RepID=A0A0A9DEP2_ARUDO
MKIPHFFNVYLVQLPIVLLKSCNREFCSILLCLQMLQVLVLCFDLRCKYCHHLP